MVKERQLTDNIFALNLEDHKLLVAPGKIYEALGYTKALPPGMEDMIQKALNLVLETSHPKAGYGLFPAESLSEKSLSIGSLVISPGKKITSDLKQAKQLALFTATLGGAIEQWTTPLASKQDPALSFIIDTIGSLQIEETAELLHQHLADKMNKRGYAVSNRYSPGYCGWDVLQQKVLFQLLPRDFCGISLEDSAFMQPRKSVSGIIGIGHRITWQDYNCKGCKNKLCHLAVNLKEHSKA